MSDPREEERERIQALLDLDTSTDAEEEIVRSAIRQGDTPGEAARRILERRNQRREARLDAFRADEAQFDAPGHSPGTDPAQEAAAAEAKKIVAAGRRAGVLPPPGEGRPRVGRYHDGGAA